MCKAPCLILGISSDWVLDYKARRDLPPWISNWFDGPNDLSTKGILVLSWLSTDNNVPKNFLALAYLPYTSDRENILLQQAEGYRAR